MDSIDEIPSERDHSTGESGDLGVWPPDVEMSPTPTWNGSKTVYSHVTHSMLGQHIEAGETLVVLFQDCAVECEVTDIHTEGDTDD